MFSSAFVQSPGTPTPTGIVNGGPQTLNTNFVTDKATNYVTFGKITQTGGKIVVQGTSVWKVI